MAQAQTPSGPPVAALDSSRPGWVKRARAFSPPDWTRGLFQNRKATIGMIILIVFTLVAIFANQLAPTRGAARIVGPGSKAPSAEWILGTSRQGQDIYAQIIHGTRGSMIVGFLTGTIIIIIAIIVGVSAGYIGGWVDELMSLITNIFLILPGLPLIIVVAGWIDRPGPFTVVVVLSATSWAYGARVLRSQTLALRKSEFVEAARVVGEPSWRIILFEILPNMTSLVASSWIGAVLFAILAEAGFAFIGLGDINAITWGSVLYWAQNNQALLTGNWWAFVPAGLCIALLGFSLTLINYGIDEITNPRLRSNEGK
jgi:peptide/nickel transport system permease protein